MGTYNTAQICINGHCITDRADTSPELTANACKKCGAKTITACPFCDTCIRGDYDTPGIVAIGFKYIVPSYCHECGEPYPWTKSALEAAKALILEDDQTTQDEQEKLIEVLPDLVTETPKTRLAESRLKRFLANSGTFVAEGVRDLIVDIASETIIKSMGLKK